MNEKKTDEDIQLESKKAHLENIKRELDLINEQKPSMSERKALLIEEIELNKVRAKIVVDNYDRLQYNWSFEKLPEYKDVMLKIEKILFKKKDIEYAQALKNFEVSESKVLEQEESLKKELDRVTKDIETIEARGESQ